MDHVFSSGVKQYFSCIWKTCSLSHQIQMLWTLPWRNCTTSARFLPHLIAALYVKCMLRRFGMEKARPLSTPGFKAFWTYLAKEKNKAPRFKSSMQQNLMNGLCVKLNGFTILHKIDTHSHICSFIVLGKSCNHLITWLGRRRRRRRRQRASQCTYMKVWRLSKESNS